MTKDSYGHVHPPSRKQGYRVLRIKSWYGWIKGDKWHKKSIGYLNLKSPLINDLKLDIGYKRDWLMEVWFVEIVEGFPCPLFHLQLSFCHTCGNDLGFGNIYDVCEDCQKELDDSDVWETELEI